MSYLQKNKNKSINTDDIFVENSSGNVGIGTTAPVGSFEVEGTTTFHNLTYTWPDNHGTAGYVLTNDGGSLSWADPGGSAGAWTLSAPDLFPDAAKKVIYLL